MGLNSELRKEMGDPAYYLGLKKEQWFVFKGRTWEGRKYDSMSVLDYLFPDDWDRQDAYEEEVENGSNPFFDKNWRAKVDHQF